MIQHPRILIKLGGAALMEPETLAITTRLIHRFRSSAYDVILVHGGGPAINAELQARGISWTFLNGQRVTTPLMMKSVEATLCGSVNGSLVRHFGAHDLPAIGLSGTDHQTLQCTAASPELGLVGKIERVNTDWMESLLDLPSRPLLVVAPLGVGAQGEAFNINADWSASHLAVALNVQQLLFLTDQPGVLDEEGEVISLMDVNGLNNLIDAKMVTGGMLTKTRAVIHALENGVHVVRVTNATQAEQDVVGSRLGTRCVFNLCRTQIEGEVHAAL